MYVDIYPETFILQCIFYRSLLNKRFPFVDLVPELIDLCPPVESPIQQHDPRECRPSRKRKSSEDSTNSDKISKHSKEQHVSNGENENRLVQFCLDVTNPISGLTMITDSVLCNVNMRNHKRMHIALRKRIWINKNTIFVNPFNLSYIL